MFSLSVLSMITLKYSTQALSRLVCAYTFKLPHVWDISRAGGGGGGGGGHTSHIVKTLVSVELTTFHQHIYLHMAALCDITSTDLQHFGAILSSIPCHMTSKHDQSHCF